MGRSTRTLRTDLPTDVWDRLAAEAAAKGLTIGRLTRELIVARDARRTTKPVPDTSDTRKRQ